MKNFFALFTLAVISFECALTFAADAEKEAKLQQFRALWAKYLDADARAKEHSVVPLRPVGRAIARAETSKTKIEDQKKVCQEFFALENEIKKSGDYTLPAWVKEERAWRSLDEKCQR